MATEEKRRPRRPLQSRKSSAGDGQSLGVMVVGLGAVATTMIAGVEAVRRGLAKPIGSLTQMGTIRLGKRTDNKFATDQGLCAAGGFEGSGLYRMGHF